MDKISAMLDLEQVNRGLSLHQSNQLLKVQKEILEVVITGGDFQHALDSLCLAAESVLPDSLASIMLFDTTRHSLKVRSAPNIPPEAVAQLNQLKPGENAGSCGTAVFKGEPQYVVDTFCDIRWRHLVPFARDFNIRACWSMPVVDGENKVIGSFALSSFSKRIPSLFQKSLLGIASSLTSLILQRERIDAQFNKVAYFDALTNLPNRALFDSRLQQAFASAQRHNKPLALFFVDLDKFKQVNDNFGHLEGDLVLKGVAERMLACVRCEDTLARVGGDEFILLVEGIADRRELQLIGYKLLTAFDKPLTTRLASHALGASIGVARYPHNATKLSQLLELADAAMYQVKKQDDPVRDPPRTTAVQSARFFPRLLFVDDFKA